MKLCQIAPVAVLAIAALLTGCTGQSSDGPDKSEKTSTSPAAKQGVVDDLLVGVKLDLSTGPWVTMDNQATFAKVVYDDHKDDSSDCVQQNCPTLLIQPIDSPEYKGRVVNGELAEDDGCAEGASAFESPVLKGTTKVAGMTADYYESAPCGEGSRTRRDWVTSKFIFTETSDDNGGLAKEAFDKALTGATVKN
jgi:hypothetical protein